MMPKATGITFANKLSESPTANVLTYEYFYNGGGVAVGDINNDGLEDIYFTANMEENALYINEGNFRFRDIAKAAGVNCAVGWKTGVTMADVNGDGFLDIYVCHSGKGDPEKRRNKLFINNRDLTFTESAEEYGLNDPGHSTHASFFDYDLDGDLDMYLLNHNVTVINEVDFPAAKKTRHPYAGDKLFRNDGGKFIDVSEAAGIKGNPLGFGLGVTVADINQDGWQDIYVSNDYIEPDYLYINNHDGSFTDRMTDYMQHISYFSMGCDVSDINNDGWADIYTVDMLPEDNERQKLLYGPENYEHYALRVLNGFYFQNMRNMLHINNTNGTYSEVGQFAGISNTDWSWAPLFADFDNDGWKDLFVTNGYYRDYTNRDFLKYKGDYFFEKARAKEKADTFHLVSTMKSTPLHNYMFRNKGDLTFENMSKSWGFDTPTFSNGGTYSDLDNDGDLDLIVNNQNEAAYVYKNLHREQQPDHHFLDIVLAGRDLNTKALGSKIMLYVGGQVQYLEKLPTRGFQSCATGVSHFGLGRNVTVDSVTVRWLGGGETTLRNVKGDQRIVIEQPSLAKEVTPHRDAATTVFSKVNTRIPYEHIEYGSNDFKRQPLLLTMLSTCGPVLAAGDVNGDGIEDVFVGGAKESPGKLYIQGVQGTFKESDTFAFREDRKCTDADALFLDVDGDGDLDLYVVSGGYNDYQETDPALQDRLYLNDGKGVFTKAGDLLPDMKVSKSTISAADWDHDGDLDLFIGGRVVPGKYPVAPQSFLLENTGGRFENVTAMKAPFLSNVGMVTDAEWVDVNADGWADLVVAGEFMPIEVVLNRNGESFEKATEKYFENPMKGFWSSLKAHDFDGDGDMDLMAGNFGLNSQLKASDKEPVSMIYRDFDNNGSVDPIMTSYVQGKPYPFASRDELLDQIYGMRSKFTDYASYSNAQLEDIFTRQELKKASTLEVNTLETSYFENTGEKFVRRAMPREAQFAPVYAIATLDYNHDGHTDMVLAGNQSAIRIRMGVMDANFGQLFKGDGKGGFTYVSQAESGLHSVGDMKSLMLLRSSGETYLLVGINNVGIETYKVNHENDE